MVAIFRFSYLFYPFPFFLVHLPALPHVRPMTQQSRQALLFSFFYRYLFVWFPVFSFSARQACYLVLFGTEASSSRKPFFYSRSESYFFFSSPPFSPPQRMAHFQSQSLSFVHVSFSPPLLLTPPWTFFPPLLQFEGFFCFFFFFRPCLTGILSGLMGPRLSPFFSPSSIFCTFDPLHLIPSLSAFFQYNRTSSVAVFFFSDCFAFDRKASTVFSCI